MSGYIDERTIERVREQADIVQTVSDYVLLKKAGTSYKGLCPFHSEKTPSFMVNPEKQIYHCFGCGEGGNVFSFVMKWENLSFPEAVKQLAEKNGVNVSFIKESPAQRENAKTTEKLYYINLAAAKYYHRLLTELPQGEPAREYLKGRGISEKTISKFLIGYAPFAWDQLMRHLQSQGFPLEIAARTGLIKERKSGTGYYDIFRSRIVFPIQNVRGKIVAFGGRLINDEADDAAESPKYLNSPESPIYEKGANLYGLNLAIEHIRQQKNAVLVEGYMDLITAHQADVRNVVASLGTALTKRQVKLLKRFAPQVTMVFDADAAGRAAAEKGHGIFLEEGLKVRAASLPADSDPDEFIKQQGAEAFTEEINKSTPLMEFIIDNAVAENDLSTIQGKVDCVSSALPFLARIENSVERGEYIKLLSEKASVPEKDIQADLGRSSTRARGRAHSPQRDTLKAEAEKDRYSAAEGQLLHLILHQKEILDSHSERLKPALFKHEEYNQIIKALLKLDDRKQNQSLSGLIDILEGDRARQLASQMMMQQMDLDDWQRTTEECLKLLEERAAEPGVSTVEMLNKTALELKEAESRGEEIGSLLRKLQELRSRLKSEGSERQLIRVERR